jgi:lysine 2,3-aminomutase
MGLEALTESDNLCSVIHAEEKIESRKEQGDGERTSEADLTGTGAYFQEKTTGFLRQLSLTSPAVRAIYTYDPESEATAVNLDRDILDEKKHSPVKGVVYKFSGRILVMLSYTCAANCRYCERQDRVGVGLDSEGRLNEEEIHGVVDFVRSRPEINEVILSGGDPLTHPNGLELIATLLAGLRHLRILRIHTRFPMQQPGRVNLDLLGRVCALYTTTYFSVHIDHPDELTPETEDILLRIRRLGFIMLGQAVFLKGVNDRTDVLRRLFVRMSELGIRPYYIYHCQAIPTTMRFVMPLEDEIRIMTELRESLSGIAFPQHVIDLQHTRGKVIVPTAHWRVDTGRVQDYDGAWIDVAERVMKPTEP